MDRMHGRHDVSIMPVSSIINQQKYITNITAIGQREDIVELITQLESVPGLVAFYGMDMYGDSHYWVDIHRSDATKGGAIELLKEELGFSRVICFGDSDNDISLFQFADECYAPENADPELKKLATAIIGHHDQDGIARFLNERFKLGIKESQ